MMENTELGRLALSNIEASPELFAMDTWGRVADCGTVACIAGHVLLAAGYRFDGYRYRRPDGVPVRLVGEEAQALLGLSDGERFGACGPSVRANDTGDLFSAEDDALARFRRLCEDG
jgi:hypothetical protein